MSENPFWTDLVDSEKDLGADGYGYDGLGLAYEDGDGYGFLFGSLGSLGDGHSWDFSVMSHLPLGDGLGYGEYGTIDD